MKNFILRKRFLLLFVFTFLLLISKSYAIDVYSNSAILIDGKTGEVLFEKNSNQKVYPASTTKILTAYIALSQGYTMKEQIIPSRTAVMSVPKGSSLAYFSENEILNLEQVLYGLMLPSGNDAANILAEHISGSVSDFADLMNSTAKNLGAINSNFVNANGLHNDNHYTTAADLAKIACACMKIEKFREIVSQSKYDMPATNISKTSRTFLNTNKLLLSGGEYFYPYATGIKTGFTTQAGNCLVASASKDGLDLISVVLGGSIIPVNKSTAFTDTISLFDYGFENYHNEQLVAQNKIITSCVPKKSGKKTLNLAAADSLNITVKNGDTPVFDHVTTINNKIVAPINKGDVLGTISYTMDGKPIGIVNLVAQDDVKKEHVIFVILRILLYFVISVIILGVSLRIFNEIRKFIKRNRRKKGNR
jgi:D-alanyl-D-alanine carboxypeptidase